MFAFESAIFRYNIARDIPVVKCVKSSPGHSLSLQFFFLTNINTGVAGRLLQSF